MKKKKKVLIDVFHLGNALTGTRTYTTQLCEGIEKCDSPDIEYIIYPNWRNLNKTTFLRGNLNVLKKILNHLLYFTWKQLVLPCVILFKGIDVIVTPDYLLPLVKFRAKALTVFHDTFYWELKGNYNELWRRYFLKSVMMGLSKRSGIIVTTNYVADKVREVVTNQYPISVVYQAPKVQAFGDEDVPSSSALSVLPTNAPYFLHVGVFDKRKNLQLLVRAFDRLLKSAAYEDIYLVLVGARAVTWFHDDFDPVKQLISELGLQDKVLMPGFVSDQELHHIYKNAYAYVFPSKEEGFGIPAIEAMRARIPVIISDQPALLEVTDGAALNFSMDSDKALADEMAKLADTGLRNELIEKGNLRGVVFSQESFFNQFHEAVKNIISQ